MALFLTVLTLALTLPISLALRLSSNFLPDLDSLQHLLDLTPRWLSFSPHPEAAPESFDDWLTSQSAHASQAILDNIGADGIRVPGASEGIVVASPSRSDPDCACRLFPCHIGLLILMSHRFLHLDPRLRAGFQIRPRGIRPEPKQTHTPPRQNPRVHLLSSSSADCPES